MNQQWYLYWLIFTGKMAGAYFGIELSKHFNDTTQWKIMSVFPLVIGITYIIITYITKKRYYYKNSVSPNAYNITEIPPETSIETSELEAAAVTASTEVRKNDEVLDNPLPSSGTESWSKTKEENMEKKTQNEADKEGNKTDSCNEKTGYDNKGLELES